MTTVWRLITHHANQSELLAKNVREGRITIGWSFIGDVRQYSSREAICQVVKKGFPGLRNWHYSGDCLWSFVHEIQVGDLVILSANGGRQCVMQVTGEYEFHSVDNEDHDYANRRSAQLVDVNPNELWTKAGGMASPGQHIYMTLIKCARKVEVS